MLSVLLLAQTHSLVYSLLGNHTSVRKSDGTFYQRLDPEHMCIYTQFHVVKRRSGGRHGTTRTVFIGYFIQEEGLPLKVQLDKIKQTTKMLAFESPLVDGVPNFMSLRQITPGATQLTLNSEEDYGKFLLTNSLLNYKRGAIYVSPVCKISKSGPIDPDFPLDVKLNVYECSVLNLELENEYQVKALVDEGKCELAASAQDSSRPVLYLRAQTLLVATALLLISSL